MLRHYYIPAKSSDLGGIIPDLEVPFRIPNYDLAPPNSDFWYEHQNLIKYRENGPKMQQYPAEHVG